MAEPHAISQLKPDRDKIFGFLDPTTSRELLGRPLLLQMALKGWSHGKYERPTTIIACLIF